MLGAPLRRGLHRHRAIILVGCLALGGLGIVIDRVAYASEAFATDWVPAQSAAMRLVAGDLSADGKTWRAGIEIRLAKNYKTYWRSPGDSGVPPMVDFTGSRNVATAELLFPMPEVFEDAAGKSIGYKDHVILPVHVQPADASKPVTLNVKLAYGVCEKLCIPAEGSASLVLPRKSVAEFDTMLRESEALVPVKAAIGQGGDISVIGIGKPIVRNDHLTFTVETQSKGPLIVLADARPSDWFLDVERPAASTDGRQRFDVVVYDPNAARKSAPCDLRLTVQSEKAAIEVPVRLDGCVEAP